MRNNVLLKEELLDRYRDLYRLLGVIELTLRERIPITLSSNSRNLHWTEVVERDPYRAAELNKYRERRENLLTESLPFGFWCRLFIPKNYSNIWRAGLFQAFPGIDNKMSYPEYLTLCRQFKRLSRLRNCVAHYQFRELSHHSKDLELVNGVLSLLRRELNAN